MPTKIIDRIFEYLENEKVPHTRFEKELELSNGYLNTQRKRHADLGEGIINKIIEKKPDWNISYLVTGKGPKYAEETSHNLVNEPITIYTKGVEKKIELQVIPLYNYEASAGLVKLFQNQLNILDYISIPNLSKCDGAIRVTGDSMYPVLKSGDIIAYKQVNDIKEGLLFGEIYALSVRIDDEDITMVKYVQKSELGKEYIKLVSQNAHHAPKDIHLSKVSAIASVKASIRYNFMQ